MRTHSSSPHCLTFEKLGVGGHVGDTQQTLHQSPYCPKKQQYQQRKTQTDGMVL